MHQRGGEAGSPHGDRDSMRQCRSDGAHGALLRRGDRSEKARCSGDMRMGTLEASSAKVMLESRVAMKATMKVRQFMLLGVRGFCWLVVFE